LTDPSRHKKDGWGGERAALEAVRRLEERLESQRDLKEKARKRIEAAREEAERLVREAREEALRKADVRRSELLAAADEEAEGLLQRAREEAGRILALAEKDRDAAAGEVLESLVPGEEG
jgi:vacuolar-type H+-ATPase subunit H